MKQVAILVGAIAALPFSSAPLAAQRGVTEINEGTVRNVYINTPLVGARGYVVGDFAKGQVRVEVMDFPASETGYEVFMFQIDAPAYMGKMFVDGNPHKGIVADPPPFSDVAALISQWYSLGDLEMDDDGQGRLNYKGGTNLRDMGLNMIMIFEKVTPGRHEGPEDVGLLMVECNGPVNGTIGSEAMLEAITIFPTM